MIKKQKEIGGEKLLNNDELKILHILMSTQVTTKYCLQLISGQMIQKE